MKSNEPRFMIAASRRILARNGCESAVAGHVSMRADDGDTFWVSPFEYFDETIPDHVIRVTMDLDVVEGDWKPSPAIKFHAGFYRARPDVNSVIHTHSHHVSVFTTLRRTIGMYNVGAVLFYEDQALYEDDGTRPPVDPDRMVAALADKRVLLIKNHGAVICSQSLERATIEAVTLESAARYHLEAERIGGTEFPPAESERGRAKYHEYFLPQMWDANLRRLERSDPDLWAYLS